MLLPTHGCGSGSILHPEFTPHSLMKASGRYAGGPATAAVWPAIGANAATANRVSRARRNMVLLSSASPESLRLPAIQFAPTTSSHGKLDAALPPLRASHRRPMRLDASSRSCCRIVDVQHSVCGTTGWDPVTSKQRSRWRGADPYPVVDRTRRLQAPKRDSSPLRAPRERSAQLQHVGGYQS